MKISRKIASLLVSSVALAALSLPPTSLPAFAQAPAGKPNILFIMGDDIGIMQPSIYHRGLMVGVSPNIHRIGNDVPIFMTFYAAQSLPPERNPIFSATHPTPPYLLP